MSKTSRVTLSPIVENGQDTDGEFEFGEDYETSFSITKLKSKMLSSTSPAKLTLLPKQSKRKISDEDDDDIDLKLPPLPPSASVAKRHNISDKDVFKLPPLDFTESTSNDISSLNESMRYASDEDESVDESVRYASDGDTIHATEVEAEEMIQFSE